MDRRVIFVKDSAQMLQVVEEDIFQIGL